MYHDGESVMCVMPDDSLDGSLERDPVKAHRI